MTAARIDHNTQECSQPAARNWRSHFFLVRPLECFGGFWWRGWTDAEQQELEGQELQIKLRSICHGQQLIRTNLRQRALDTGNSCESVCKSAHFWALLALKTDPLSMACSTAFPLIRKSEVGDAWVGRDWEDSAGPLSGRPFFPRSFAWVNLSRTRMHRVEIGHQRLVRPQILHRNQFVGPTFSIGDHVASPDQIKWAARPLLRADLQLLHFAIDISSPADGSSNLPNGGGIVERCPPAEPTL